MADPVNQVELPAYALPQRSETGRKFKDLVQRNNSTRWANCGRKSGGKFATADLLRRLFDATLLPQLTAFVGIGCQSAHDNPGRFRGTAGGPAACTFAPAMVQIRPATKAASAVGEDQPQRGARSIS